MAGKPDCPDCDGTGWKQLVRDGITAVERCGCVEVHHKETLWERAAMPARFQSAGFENFRLPRENPIAYENLGVAMNDARVFAREYPFTPKPGLMFQGNPGVGKTHLALYLAITGVHGIEAAGIFPREQVFQYRVADRALASARTDHGN